VTSLVDLPPEPNGGWLRRRHEKRIRELTGICAASIADELGLQERTVVMLQRKLGLRSCRQPGRGNCD
jgi:hypothetical protein